MSISVIEYLTRGTHNFLRGDATEVRAVIPRAEEVLPRPQTIFLKDEIETPLLGFPILRSKRLAALEKALEIFLEAEIEAQIAVYRRQGFNSRAYAERWEHYRTRLAQAMENFTVARHGGNYGAIFWLHHSLAVVRLLNPIPKRLLRQDLNLGREHGDEIKYKIFFKWIDKVVNAAYDTANRLAPELAEEEDALFPTLLALMRDNVLIFTEDYIGPDLSQLTSYFNGCLRIDGRDLRQRLAALERWHEKSYASDPVLRAAVAQLLGDEPQTEARSLLNRAGYVSFLASHVTYSPA